MRLILILLTFASLLFGYGNEYKFEGLYNDDGEKRLFLMARFLPYDPVIYALSTYPGIAEKCAYWWPKGTFFRGDPQSLPNKNLHFDVLWIDSEDAELQILQNFALLLAHAKIVYTTTHFFNEGAYFQELKDFLKKQGFSLLSHWYWEGEHGKAIFVRSDIFEAAMRSLYYTPRESYLPIPLFSPEPLKRYFKKAEQKTNEHSFGTIDFIYLINLDERPEKFAQSSINLQLYGINPYRFSAVNGWKLPFIALQDIATRFTQGMIQEKFLATTYKEIEGHEYISNELIREDGTPYFALGLSRGAIGIVLSHLSILQDAYDSGYNTIWVMEDDVDVVDNPCQIPHLIRSLDQLAPDWDILFTDVDTKDHFGNRVPCRAVAARPNYNMKSIHSFFQHFYTLNADLSRIGMRYGAYSMILRRSGIEKILHYFKTYYVFLPYDMDFWLAPDLKMYTVNKDIISHRAGAPSDNSEPGYLKKSDINSCALE